MGNYYSHPRKKNDLSGFNSIFCVIVPIYFCNQLYYLAHTLTLQRVSWTETHLHASCFDKQINLHEEYLCKSYPSQSALQYSDANMCHDTIYFKTETAKKQQKGPQFISRIYNFSIPPLKVLQFYMQGLCWQFTAFANYSPLEIPGLKIKIKATKVTLLALFWTHFVTSLQRKMHVFVCVCWGGGWEELHRGNRIQRPNK